MSAWIKVHRKLLTAVAGSGITAAVGYWGTGNHWVELGILAATCLGVYQIPNKSI